MRVSNSVLIMNATAGRSGVDIAAMQLAIGLRARGWDVTYSAPKEPPFVPDLIRRGVRYENDPETLWWYPPNISEAIFENALQSRMKELKSTIELVRRVNPDVIVANTSVSLAPVLVGRLLGIPVVTHIHALMVSNIYRTKSELLERTQLSVFAEGPIVVPSTVTAKALAEAFPETRGRVQTIHNGVDLEVFRPSPLESQDGQLQAPAKTPRTILSLGHLNENKNQEFLVAVAKELSLISAEEIIFKLLGPDDGWYSHRLQELISQEGVEQYFEISGTTASPEIALREAWAYANTSRTETFPISVLEALASGLPVLATPTQGATEILGDSNAGCVTLDPRQMAEHIVQLLDSEFYNDRSQAARQLAEQSYSVDAYVDSFEKVLVHELSVSSHRKPDLLLASALGMDFLYSAERHQHPNKIMIGVVVADRDQVSTHLLIEQALGELSEKSLVNWAFIEPSASHSTLARFDLILILRRFDSATIELVKRSKEVNIPVFFETDDNYFALRFGPDGPIHKSWKNRELRQLAHAVDGVLVYSKKSQADFSRYNSNVTILPTFQNLPTGDSLPERLPSPHPILGYVGSLRREIDFKFVLPALQQLLSERPDLEIQFAGFVPSQLKNHPRVSSQPFDSDYERFMVKFRQLLWTIGIAPLADTGFNNSKTPNKYREFAGAGIPAVYSSVEPFADVIEDGVTGLLSKNTSSAWHAQISKLLDSAELRKSIATNAYRDMAENYQLAQHAQMKLDIFRRAVERSAAAKAESHTNESDSDDVIETYVERAISWPGGKTSLYLNLAISRRNESPVGIELVLNGVIVHHTSFEAPSLPPSIYVISSNALADKGRLAIRVFAPSKQEKLKVAPGAAGKPEQLITHLSEA